MITQFFTMLPNGEASNQMLDVESFEEFIKLCDGFQSRWETNAIDLYVGDMLDEPLVVFRKEEDGF
jgi:hypothetical protein